MSVFFNILTKTYTCDECYRDVNPVDNSGHKAACSGSNELKEAAQHGFGGAIYMDGKWIVPNV